MKKSNLISGMIYFIVGVVCLTAALLIDSKAENLLCGFAGAGIVCGVMQIYKYFYWNSPKHIERYKEKMETQNIEIHDELKDKIRCKSAQYVYAIGLCTVSISIVVFAVLDSLEILENGNVFVLYLSAYMIFQMVCGRVIFRHILKKYE